MLVLSRKVNEKIIIDDEIALTVIQIRGDKVRLGFEARREIVIHRQEVYDRIARLNRQVNPDPPGDAPRSDPADSARRA
jgi:carbon storage regulator